MTNCFHQKIFEFLGKTRLVQLYGTVVPITHFPPSILRPSVARHLETLPFWEGSTTETALTKRVQVFPSYLKEVSERRCNSEACVLAKTSWIVLATTGTGFASG